MAIQVTDPLDELKERKRQIDAADSGRGEMDAKELAERSEAAARMSVEDEKLYVDYVTDCINCSIEATKELREAQDECYRVYLEEEPAGYANKDAWQSRIVVPKPFGTVQQGAAIIKKAFSPDYLSIVDEGSHASSEFWKDVMDLQNNDQHGNFVVNFADAVVMALAVGVSMEVIPRWVPGVGLEYALVEPWKIKRDPSAPRRNPQGGLYWIHQEWLDWHVLRGGEKSGKYFDVARAKNSDASTTAPNDPFMSQEAIAERKKQTVKQSEFRTLHLVSEFYGAVLDRQGEILLPKAQMTVCGGRVIEKPRPVPYKKLRWPGIYFSPFPELLGAGGRGLIKGVVSVWEAMCNLQCLFEDGLLWVVNPPKEICVDNLVDVNDVEDWPGKKYLVHETVNGQQAIRETTRKDVTGSILANQQYHDQLFQRGTLVTDAVQGLPGYRKDVTARESEQNLGQGLTVFQLIGQNVEAGAVWSLVAAQDVIETFAGYSDYLDMFGRPVLDEMMIGPDTRGTPNGVNGVPQLTGRFHVSGVSALMKDAETLQHLVSVFLPLGENPAYAKYLKPYKMVRALETRTNLTDEGLVVSEEEARAIDEQERAAIEKANAQLEAQAAAEADAAAAESEAAKKQAEMDEIKQLADLATSVKGGREAGKKENAA